ncbi:DUF3426 domain-containing protein [Lysobacter sp. D1-1-M9]|uniref:DUF3426 domain-containing protein n=1 Tax=Novilysobacter longmucuonensis TaxID=3098603 RepID=UPI002FCCADDF
MSVPCPHCGFLVASAASGDGMPQRCPRCAQPLQAAADPADTDRAKPAGPIETAADAESEVDPTLATATDVAPEDPVAPPAAVAGQVPARTPPRTGRRRGSPSFARVPVTRGVHMPRWPEVAVLVVLVVVLALQLLLAQRVELAADARWRPWLAGLCEVLRCQVPPWQEPAAYTMLNRSVQPRPGQAGVLDVNASFRNDARWPQPWPILVLSLADLEGKPLGMRAFAPQEYRSDGGAATLAPGQSASVQFSVVEPSPRIVAFTFEFR